MKRLYWIDDDIQEMIYVAHGAIKKLWKLNDFNAEGISSKVLIFGNAFESTDKDEVPTKDEEAETFRELYQMFLEECMVFDGPDRERPVYNAKKILIQDPVCYLYKKEVSGDLDAYREMKKIWISGELDSDTEDYEKAEKEADLLLERMCIEPESVVGIDIMLLFGDHDRLWKKKRILSMELYHKLSNKNIGCFLYSSDAWVEELRQNWLQQYTALYGDKNVVIYKRTEVMQKGDTNIVEEIEKMFEKVQKINGGKSDGDRGAME